MKKINKIVLSVCCVATSAVMIYVSKQRTMVSDIISNNVEALVSGDDHPGYDKNNLYMTDAEDGNMFGFCGEITTGDPNFTLCYYWYLTQEKWLHDVCYTKK